MGVAAALFSSFLLSFSGGVCSTCPVRIATCLQWFPVYIFGKRRAAPLFPLEQEQTLFKELRQ